MPAAPGPPRASASSLPLFVLLLLLWAESSAATRHAPIFDVLANLCHLEHHARPGARLECDSPLRIHSTQKSEIILQESSGFFGIFPEFVKPGHSFGLFVKNDSQLIRKFIRDITITGHAEDGGRETLELNLKYDNGPLAIPELDNVEYTVHVSDDFTEGILHKFVVQNPRKTQPTAFDYKLHGSYSELFTIEPADPDLLLLRTGGCANRSCRGLPAHFPLLLRMTDGRQPAADVLINVRRAADRVRETELRAEVLEFASHFAQLVRVPVLHAEGDTFAFEFERPSSVFYVQPASGVLSIQEPRSLSVDLLGWHHDFIVLVHKDDRLVEKCRVHLTIRRPVQFEQADYSFTVPPMSRVVGSVRVNSAESDLLYMKVAGDETFAVHSNGTITYSGPFGADASYHQVKVGALVADKLALCTVRVAVAGFGSHPAELVPRVRTLALPAHQLAAGQPVAQLAAIDRDAEVNLFYNLTAVACRDWRGRDLRCARLAHVDGEGRVYVSGARAHNVSLAEARVSVRDLNHPSEPADHGTLWLAFSAQPHTRAPLLRLNVTLPAHYAVGGFVAKLPAAPNASFSLEPAAAAAHLRVDADGVVRTRSAPPRHLRVRLLEQGRPVAELQLRAAAAPQPPQLRRLQLVELREADQPGQLVGRASLPADAVAVRLNVPGRFYHMDLSVIFRIRKQPRSYRYDLRAQLYEPVEAGHPVARIPVEAGHFNYTLTPDATFVVDAHGVIRTRTRVEGRAGRHVVHVQGRDGRGNRADALLTVDVKRDDSPQSCDLKLDQTAPFVFDEKVGYVKAESRCAIQYETDDPDVAIDGQTGQVTLLRDFEEPKIVALGVRSGAERLQTELALGAGRRCALPLLRLRVAENAAAGTLLAARPVLGLDGAARLRLRRATPWLRVDARSGALRTARALDRELAPLLQLQLEVEEEGARPALHCDVLVEVMDENDNAPQFTQSEYDFAMEESQLLGQLVGRVRAEDPDDSDATQLQYSILSCVFFRRGLGEQIAAFELDGRSGELRLARRPDELQQGVFELDVQVVDGQGLHSDLASVRVWVYAGGQVLKVQRAGESRGLREEIRQVARKTGLRIVTLGVTNQRAPSAQRNAAARVLLADPRSMRILTETQVRAVVQGVGAALQVRTPADGSAPVRAAHCYACGLSVADVALGAVAAGALVCLGLLVAVLWLRKRRQRIALDRVRHFQLRNERSPKLFSYSSGTAGSTHLSPHSTFTDADTLRSSECATPGSPRCLSMRF